MFPEQLKKILQLIKKTGDRVIIFDGANPNDSYVIMDVDSYAAGVSDDDHDYNHDGCCGNCSDGCCEEDDMPEIPEEDDGQPETPVEMMSEKPVAAESVIKEKKPDIIEKVAEEQNLTEEDLTDRINQEISMWKNQDKAQTLAEEDKVKKSWQIPPAVKDKAKNIE